MSVSIKDIVSKIFAVLSDTGIGVPSTLKYIKSGEKVVGFIFSLGRLSSRGRPINDTDYCVSINFTERYVITLIHLADLSNVREGERARFFERLLVENLNGETVFAISSIKTIVLTAIQSYKAFSKEVFEDELKEAVFAIPIFQKIAKEMNLSHGTNVEGISERTRKLGLQIVEKP